MSVTTESNINTANYPNPIREELVQTAVKFLQNHNVVNTPLAQKQQFLQRKGFTDQEIQEACERAGAYDLHEQQQKAVVPGPVYFPQKQYKQLAHLSWLDQIKEFVHNTALLSIVIYAIYKFYQKFIRRFLFGDKKKSVESSIEDLEKNVGDIRTSVDSVKIEIDRISQNTGNETRRQLQDLKSEISSVKGLLLTRKQFPSVSSNTPVVPPSIPAWQLASAGQDTDPEQDQKEELLEIGSGSGSSEPEHTTKNSDSSLEIIYSSKHDMLEDSSMKYGKGTSLDEC